MSSSVNNKGEVIAIKRSLKQLEDDLGSRQSSNYFAGEKKTIISDTLKFSLDFHLEASKDDYANNHMGKLFLYNLRLDEFKPKWLSK